MQRLELDFRKPARSPSWAGFALLVISLAFCGDLAHSYVQLNARSKALSATLASAPQNEPVRIASTTPPSAEDFAFARDAFRRLSTPWSRLFAALEGAQSDRVALLAIEPDAEAGSVTISAEARSYLDALTYVANLDGQKTLERVHLVRHEVSRGNSARPLSFTVSAAWRKKP